MKNNQTSITTLVAIGIGAAVFFILGRFLSIPTGVPNTSIETTYPFLALMATIFGPFAGLFIGLIGHAIKDLLTYGLWWSWVLTSGFAGYGFGIVGRRLKVNEGIFTLKNAIQFNIGQVIVNVLSWVVIAPVLDILIYSEPANKVFLQGGVSALVNALSVGIIGTLLLKGYASTRTKSRSLRKEQ
ncbi:ECF-type riboflavin transporter substrate-binding protein [Aerococcus viridans]|uniref:ECF-type riboflavin transporter substrate-binding protein n=1 Tax=Aerococcus viridans TaxID=1377 RepID=UPI0028FD3123|nr:ECF-type riboflavin transporter substrate-binding protein [Aerococcus viridans]